MSGIVSIMSTDDKVILFPTPRISMTSGRGGGQRGVIHRHLSLTQQCSHSVLLVLTLKMLIQKPVFHCVIALLRYYAAFIGNFLPTFRDSRTDRLSPNVSNYQLTLRNVSEERKPHLRREGSLKQNHIWLERIHQPQMKTAAEGWHCKETRQSNPTESDGSPTGYGQFLNVNWTADRHRQTSLRAYHTHLPFKKKRVLLLLQSFAKLMTACNVDPCIDNTLCVRVYFITRLVRQGLMKS